MKLLRASMLAAFFCSGVFSVQASEIFSAAGSAESGKWSFSFLGRGSETKPKLKLSSDESIQIPGSSGSSSVFQNSDAEIKLEQHQTQILAVAEFQPKDGLRYKIKAGQVQQFGVEFSSGSQANKLEALKDGFVWGVGIGGSIAPGSVVSTGIRWQLDYTQTTIDLDRLQGGDVVYAVSQRLREEELQGSLTFSRRWKSFEPYGGLKIFQLITHLQDNTSKARVSGKTDEVSPFVGVKYSVTEHEDLVVEGSFVGEKSLSAGFKLNF